MRPPKEHGRVCAPGTPGLRAVEQPRFAVELWREPLGYAPQHEIAGGKCVRLGATPHRNVLRRPGTDPLNIQKMGHRSVEIAGAVKTHLPVDDCSGQRAERRGTRTSEADSFASRAHQLSRAGVKPSAGVIRFRVYVATRHFRIDLESRAVRLGKIRYLASSFRLTSITPRSSSIETVRR